MVCALRRHNAPILGQANKANKRQCACGQRKVHTQPRHIVASSKEREKGGGEKGGERKRVYCWMAQKTTRSTARAGRRRRRREENVDPSLTIYTSTTTATHTHGTLSTANTSHSTHRCIPTASLASFGKCTTCSTRHEHGLQPSAPFHNSSKTTNNNQHNTQHTNDNIIARTDRAPTPLTFTGSNFPSSNLVEPKSFVVLQSLSHAPNTRKKKQCRPRS